MSRVRRIRALLHRPYLRAAVVALSLVAAAGAFATVALELRFGVPAQAVLRYFARLHSGEDDLRPLLRQPATLAALAELSYSRAGMNTGGLVYSEHGVLRFHPWMPAAALDSSRASGAHHDLYARLLTDYLSAELDGLIGKLSHPETRRSLGRLGVSPQRVDELRRRAAGDPGPAERLRLLRHAAAFIRPFMPSGTTRHHLDLGDKLRFYSGEAPSGRYVGLYEVRGPGWLPSTAPVPLPEAGRLLAIDKRLDGAILIADLRPSGRRVYRLTPVPHPAGLSLYRLGRRA